MPMRTEVHRREEEARYERGRQQVIEHTALAERKRTIEDARKGIALLEADIRNTGYAGQGPLLEQQRQRLADALALTGTPSQAELAAARDLVAERYGLVALDSFA